MPPRADTIEERMTVACPCGIRVRSETRRFRDHPPCPSCGKPLPSIPERKSDKRISAACRCGLDQTYPAERAGLWVDCPRCGDRRMLPGQRSHKRKALPVDLPGIREATPPDRAGRLRFLILALAVLLAALYFVRF